MNTTTTISYLYTAAALLLLLPTASNAFSTSNTLQHSRIKSTALSYQTAAPKIDNEEPTVASSLPFFKSIPSTSLTSSVGKLPWLNDDDEGDCDSNVFSSHWNWQLEYFEEHLTNLRINPDFAEEELMYVETNSDQEQQQQRIYTISMQSDEYRDIRMTYLHCGDKAQIFRCTCYPRNDMPILGMGMMQFAGSVRNVAIIDFQPLLDEDDDGQALYTSTLEHIRSAANPALQQPMSNRHFDATDQQKYFTANPIIGKWGKAENDINELAKLDNALCQTHQECVRAHVQLTQASVECPTPMSNLADTHVQQLHADYDTFVAAKEPASQLLSSAFGKETAEMLVHDILFPLSSKNTR